MMTQSDEAILDDRLRNWGRWIADRRYPRSNMIYRLMVAAGEIKLEPRRALNIDHADAILVDRAWRMLPQNPIRYWAGKHALIAHYAYPTLPVRAFLDWIRQESQIQFHLERPLRLNQKDYDVILKTARYEIFNLIEYRSRKNPYCNRAKNEYY